MILTAIIASRFGNQNHAPFLVFWLAKPTESSTNPSGSNEKPISRFGTGSLSHRVAHPKACNLNGVGCGLIRI